MSWCSLRCWCSRCPRCSRQPRNTFDTFALDVLNSLDIVLTSSWHCQECQKCRERQNIILTSSRHHQECRESWYYLDIIWTFFWQATNQHNNQHTNQNDNLTKQQNDQLTKRSNQPTWSKHATNHQHPLHIIKSVEGLDIILTSSRHFFDKQPTSTITSTPTKTTT